MQAKFSGNVLAKIKAIAVSAKSTNKNAARSVKRDTLDDARTKVIDKLIANRDYFKGLITEGQDSVYKQQADGTYTVGVKYGNRYLDGIIDGGKYAEQIEEEALAAVIDVLVDCTRSGEFDAAIETVMHANVTARNTKKH